MVRIFFQKVYWYCISLFFFTVLFFSCREKPPFKSLYNPDETDYYIEDGLAGHLHKPFAKREFEWQEHPLGKIVVSTNNFGFKEDENTPEEKSPEIKRILITGDSHTDGVVYNEETFPNQLEKMLNSGHKNYEVLNGGVGYYGPQNYLGFLKKHLFLAPDFFYVAVYTGNDFLDGVRIESENNRLDIPVRPPDYFVNLWRLDDEMPGMSGQAMNQIKFFKQFPDLKKKGLDIFRNSLTEIKKICLENNIGLMVLLIPTKLDAEPHSDSVRINKASSIMGFSEEDLGMNSLLTEELYKWLLSEKIEVVSISGEMKKREGEFFWKQDLHLNVEGHKVVAETIFERMEKQGGAGQP